MSAPGTLVPVALGWHTTPPPEGLVGVQSVHVDEDGTVGKIGRLARDVAERMEKLGRLMGAPLG
jgi:hypothetical protein